MYSRKSIKEYRRTLSDREARFLSSLSHAGKAVFAAEDAKQLVAEPKNILDSLVRKRWILKIRKGVYAIAPFEAGELGAASHTLHSFAIASVLVTPYSIGYWSALNHHGLTDETPPSVYIATTKPRNSRKILGAVFRFVTIPRYKMFGTEEAEIEGRKIIISTKEKTLVDCLDHPEHCGGIEAAARALYFHREELDARKLVAFAKRLGNSAVIKRLGVIAESLGLENLAATLSREKLGSGYSQLDPSSPRRGRIVERWKLEVNAPVDPARWSR